MVLALNPSTHHYGNSRSYLFSPTSSRYLLSIFCDVEYLIQHGWGERCCRFLCGCETETVYFSSRYQIS